VKYVIRLADGQRLTAGLSAEAMRRRIAEKVVATFSYEHARLLEPRA
jgi:hypothetical protein